MGREVKEKIPVIFRGYMHSDVLHCRLEEFTKVLGSFG